MPGFWSNPFDNATLPTVEPRGDDRFDRRMSTVSLEEPELNWHERVLFGAPINQPRRRRASSFGEVPQNSVPQPQDGADAEQEPSRPDAFRFRTPSVVDARVNGLGRTRARQGSVAGGRRPSTYDRRTSISDRRTSISDRRGSSGRRPSLTATGTDNRSRQPSVAWARQSSIIDRQLANLTWTRAEDLYALDDKFYSTLGDATKGLTPAPWTEKILDPKDKISTVVTVVPTTTTSDPEKVTGVVEELYPSIADPKDPARVLGRTNLRGQKFMVMAFVLLLNIGCMLGAILGGGPAGTFVFTFILFVKSKDFLSVVLAMFYMPLNAIRRYFKPPPPVTGKWILTLIPAYSESEEQIVKTIRSLRDNNVAPHEQVMVVMLDGKARDVKNHMRILKSFRRPYVTFKWKRGELLIDAGFVDEVPVIVFEKVKNAGKKDSLILCHDLFNEMRDNAPLYTKLLREEIWRKLLPTLTANKSIPFEKFDMVFCTDADSTIYDGALAGLANALIRDPYAIASCGLVLVELEPGKEWSLWNLYQQFQYTFGQFVRRRAEGIWGKVTCLPGCITMIAVRPEMAGAIRKYAEAITKTPVIHHQVQYLGTDRRLTYSMLSQSRKLHTVFVPSAVSETVAPQSLLHYLSQRRRWGSNAYFNNFFYFLGDNMILITRLAACIELVRLSLVYYRIANTLMFVKGLVTEPFSIIKLAPLLVVSQLPTAWYFANMVWEPQLRRRAHKILLGYMINKLVSPFLAMTVFYNVLRNLGSQVWGMTGGSNATATAVATIAVAVPSIAADTKTQPLQTIHSSPPSGSGSDTSSTKEKSDLGVLSELPEEDVAPNVTVSACTENETSPQMQPAMSPLPSLSVETSMAPFAHSAMPNFGNFSMGDSETPKTSSPQLRSAHSGVPRHQRQYRVSNNYRRRSSAAMGSLDVRRGSITVGPLDTRRGSDTMGPLDVRRGSVTVEPLDTRRGSDTMGPLDTRRGSDTVGPLDARRDSTAELSPNRSSHESSPGQVGLFATPNFQTNPFSNKHQSPILPDTHLARQLSPTRTTAIGHNFPSASSRRRSSAASPSAHHPQPVHCTDGESPTGGHSSSAAHSPTVYSSTAHFTTPKYPTSVEASENSPTAHFPSQVSPTFHTAIRNSLEQYSPTHGKRPRGAPNFATVPAESNTTGFSSILDFAFAAGPADTSRQMTANPGSAPLGQPRRGSINPHTSETLVVRRSSVSLLESGDQAIRRKSCSPVEPGNPLQSNPFSDPVERRSSLSISTVLTEPVQWDESIEKGHILGNSESPEFTNNFARRGSAAKLNNAFTPAFQPAFSPTWHTRRSSVDTPGSALPRLITIPGSVPGSPLSPRKVANGLTAESRKTSGASVRSTGVSTSRALSLDPIGEVE